MSAVETTSDLLGERGAMLSDCRRYRYRLWRRWGDGPTVLFVMLNPSTADALQDDPTIRRCIGFAQRWGAGRLEVVNLYAWRATNPRELDGVWCEANGWASPTGEYGPWHYTSTAGPFMANRNDVIIEEAAREADRIVAAWGAWSGPDDYAVARVLEDLLPQGRVEALALTKHGQPRHPLYVRGDVEPVPYGERG